jgi:hypothetical protein
LQDARDTAGKVLYVLEVAPAGLEPIVWYFDAETHLLSKQAYAAAAGQPVVEEVFSDYRPVGRVQVAHVTTVRADGRPILERKLSRIELNAELDPALFTRPAP